MKINRVVEYSFFFILLGLAGYMVWLITAPLISAVALSAIIATICYPVYQRVLKVTPRKSKTVAALITTFLSLLVIILPLISLSSLVVSEFIGAYQSLSDENSISLNESFASLEESIQAYIPGFEIDVTEQLQLVVQWFAGNLTQIFAGTLSTFFLFLIAMIGTFYFFRDGEQFLQLLVRISPLPDREDKVIYNRMTRAVRTVATGTLFLALIQGVLVAIGFTIAGIDNVILWGAIASIFATVPGIGTSIVTYPAIFWLFYTGDITGAIVLAGWSIVVVTAIDNMLGPYLMSRGNNLHPFIILISVLGGIALFGPIGFIVGPVIVTLFLVLLEIYSQYIVKEQLPSEAPDSELIGTLHDKA